MSNLIDRILNAEVAPGIYRLDMTLRPTSLCRQVSLRGWRCFYLDGSAIVNKQSLLAKSATVMGFPDYFGYNWDAYEECITDLTWIEEPGRVLLYDHAAVLVAQHPDVWEILYSILESAVDYWTSKTTPFYVLLRNVGRIRQSVPAL